MYTDIVSRYTLRYILQSNLNNSLTWNVRSYQMIYFVRLQKGYMFPKTKNRDLFFARAYYLAFMGGWGFILPFINLFYIGLGLSGTQIGTIGSVSSIVGLIVSPIIVTEIKKRPQARGILQASLILGAIGYFLLGQQVTFLAILLIIFLQSLVGAGIMPASDAMAVHVSEEAGTGYGSVRVWASVGWIITVLSSGWLIERNGFQ